MNDTNFKNIAKIVRETWISDLCSQIAEVMHERCTVPGKMYQNHLACLCVCVCCILSIYGINSVVYCYKLYTHVKYLMLSKIKKLFEI